MDPRRIGRIQELDNELTPLDQSRDDILRQLAHIDDAMKRRRIERASYMPVNQLPNEIICMILRYAFVHDPERCYLQHPTTTKPADPIPISHTSRRFRSVALAMPELWSCFHLDLDTLPNDADIHQTLPLRHKLETFLARSEPLDIAVHLQHLATEWNADPPNEDHPTAPLFAERSRWRWCTVTICHLEALDSVLNTIHFFNHLEFLQIEPDDPGAISVGCHCLHSPQSLTHLRIREAILPMNSPLLQNLQELVVSDFEISIDYLRQMGENAPFLKRLVLDTMVTDLEDADASIPQPIAFPSLHSVTIIIPNDEYDGYGRIICWFKAPKLETIEFFRIRGVVSRPVIWDANIPALRELRIAYSSTRWIDLDSLRQLAAGVEHLDLSGTDAHKIIRELMAAHSIPFMRSLRSILVTKLEVPNPSGMLADLVRRRAEFEHPIVQLKLGRALHWQVRENLWMIARFTDVKVVDASSVPRYWAASELPDYMIANYAHTDGSHGSNHYIPT